LPTLDRRSRLCVSTFAGLYEGQLERIEANGYDVFSRSCRLPVPAKVAVVGGGLAGLAAALELVDAGHEVTVYEARPVLGGAVQTLPAREGDPEPPPDNGQHIALGCFTEYLRFLDRIGESGSYLRKHLSLPVIDERGEISRIAPARVPFYRHISFRDRVRLVAILVR